MNIRYDPFMEKKMSSNRAKLKIRYDGEALSDHSMDVSILGPALTGLGEVLRSANRAVNGENVSVRVNMNADVDANCVTMDFVVIQSVWEAITSLLSSEDVKNAKELLDWVGIAGGATGGVWSVWQLYKWLVENRKPGQSLKTTQDGDTITININGNDNSVSVGTEVFQIASQPEVQKGIKKILEPLDEPGIDKVEFIQGKKKLKITEKEARPILDSGELDLDPASEVQMIVGHIVIHSPQFDLRARSWKFKWNDRIESINIAQANIAKTIIERGRVNVGDAFKVKMEVKEKKIKSGFKHQYKVVEVLGFVPNDGQQLNLPSV